MMGAGLAGKTNYVIRSLELESHDNQPGLQGEKEGWRVSQITWPMI